MSSTNKTTNLQLNSWIGADKPQREDFNRDNRILDETIHTHCADSSIHITEQERTAWDAPYYIGSYIGNGAASRNVAIGSPFEPEFGLLFAVSTPPGVNDYQNSAHYNYFALMSKSGASAGAALNGMNLTVSQSSVPILGKEYKSFNESGIVYVYVVFR